MILTFVGAATDQGAHTENTDGPHVLLVGNSLTKDIRPEWLSKAFDTTITRASTIEQAKDVITALSSTPNVVAFQLTTNDVRDTQPQAVTDAYVDLIQTTETKLPQSKILISLAPHANDTSRQATRTAVVNGTLQDTYHDTDVRCISNGNIYSFAADSVHLTRQGTSTLARNIKEACNKAAHSLRA